VPGERKAMQEYQTNDLEGEFIKRSKNNKWEGGKYKIGYMRRPSEITSSCATREEKRKPKEERQEGGPGCWKRTGER